MNQCFRLVFNRALQRWCVASELARARGKSGRFGTAAKLAGVTIVSLALPVDALAACKKPWEWVNEGLLFPFGKPQQERTPHAGYSIKWLGDGTPVSTGSNGRAMPYAWLDHYCEQPTPQQQNLTVENHAIYGGNGSNASGFGTGGNGGRGGDGGGIFVGVLSDDGRIAVSGDGVHALKAHSRGGDGGHGGNGGSIVGSGGSGGLGGNGGIVSMLNVGSVSTGGKDAPAMSGFSEGGTGGRGGSGGWAPWSNPGDGRPGGNSGSAVNIVNLGSLATAGTASDGIIGKSVGGNGGNGGVRGSTLGLAIGGDGGGGGTAGLVQVQNKGSITTKGIQSDAISAQAFGGGGGDGGMAMVIGITASVAIGGGAGSGGNSGHVDVVNAGSLNTSGKDAMGIRAQTIGGGGGTGGASIAGAVGPYFASSTSIGGKGGDGGKGGFTRIYNLQNANIVTGAALAEKYRNITTLEHLDAVDVLAPNWKDLDSGSSHGIFAQSIGGGGGSGGSAISAALAVGDSMALSATVALGGSGGGGGNGGVVEVYNQDASVTTYDRLSNAILAQSVGGGGGAGGDTLSVSAAASAANLTGAIAVNVGGAGGSGGHGDEVKVETGRALATWGAGSTAVLAQSVGGGGGNAGSILDIGAGFGTSAFKVGVNLGRSGGNGGNGSTVTVNPTMATASTAIQTLGDNSTGIRAQSVGGGGGSGSSIKSYAVSLQSGDGVAGTATLNLGGSGGSGGLGGTVNVNYNGRMETNGAHSQGILAQSIGGGGGAGGNVMAVSVAASLNSNKAGSNGGGAFTANANVGGVGGTGNHAGPANLNIGSNTNIVTTGMRSPGVMVQSVGGGGGQGGNTHSYSVATSLPSRLSGQESTLGKLAAGVKAAFVRTAQEKAQDKGQTSLSVSVNVGGAGGAAGSGGTVWAGLSGNVSTLEEFSYGVFAQSVGGGGGSGGTAFTTGIEGVGAYTVGLSFGGAGGGGGSGGTVLVGIQSTPARITTQGTSSHGILAQSVGGGGGEGGFANVVFADYSKMSKVSAAFSMGGSGGTSGNGSTVRVFNAATVATQGAGANGVVAQSIGGGGGAGGSTGIAAAIINVGLGGNGASAGNGGDVHVGHVGVTTAGDNAIGILAQSIGGGGGLAGIGETGQEAVQVSVGVGGKGGAGGNGGIVNVGCLGEYTTAVGCARGISTAGKVAHGIMAQSIGGGGGLTQGTKVSFLNAPLGLAPKWDINLGSFGRWKDVTNGNSGKVSVHDFAASRYDIRTSGDGAIGIIAQSLSGGGGALSLNRDSATSEYRVNYSNNIEIQGNGAGGNGGVDVYLAGSVVTTGKHAHGIFAQSLAGSQTVFGNDGVQVYGGTAITDGRIDIATASTTNINVSGAGAHGIVSMSNRIIGTSSAQWLKLHGNIAATGADAWGVKATNGFAPGGSFGQTPLIAVDAHGTIKGGKASAGAIRIENFNAGVSSLYVQPGGKVTTDRASTADCAATSCHVVSMYSNHRNNLLIMEGGAISGGIVGLDTTDAAQGNFVTVDGSLSSLPSTFEQTARLMYEQPVIQVSHGWTEIAVGSKGSIAGKIDIPYVRGKITNDGTMTGRVNAFNSDYTNRGKHVLSVPGSGGAGVYIDVKTLDNDASKGEILVELLSLPSSFRATELVKAETINLGRGVTAMGAATKLDVAQTANRVTITDARVDFAVRGLAPGLMAAANIANDQANSGLDGDAGDAPSVDEYELYDLLLDMANEGDSSEIVELLDNFSLGYSDAALTLGAAWYAANHLQSCGDNKLASTSVIEQGNCSWTKLAYDDMELADGAQKGHSWGFNSGWQHELREHVYVGLSAGYAATDFANFGIAESDGHRVTLGGIVKYVNGNVFGAASVIGALSTADGKRAIDVPGMRAVAKSERDTWLLSSRVRGGYNFALDRGVSVTPSLELNVPLVHDEGYRETGGGDFNMEVLSSTNVVPDLYPALQVSRQFAVGNASWRGWVEAGKRVRFGDFDTNVRMPDGFSPDTLTSVNFDPGRTSTLWSMGLLIEWNEKLEARVLYEHERGGGMKSQSGSVKLAWKI